MCIALAALVVWATLVSRRALRRLRLLLGEANRSHTGKFRVF